MIKKRMVRTDNNRVEIVQTDIEADTKSAKSPDFEEEMVESGQKSDTLDSNSYEAGTKFVENMSKNMEAARSLFGGKDGVQYQATLEKVVKQISTWDVAELMGLRSAVDNLLPPSFFSDLDLLKEKRLDLSVIKQHRDVVMNDEKTAENHKTQLIIAYNQAFDAYVKLEKDLYTVERVRALERAAIRALGGLEPTVKEEFLKVYQAEYNRLRPDGEK